MSTDTTTHFYMNVIEGDHTTSLVTSNSEDLRQCQYVITRTLGDSSLFGPTVQVVGRFRAQTSTDFYYYLVEHWNEYMFLCVPLPRTPGEVYCAIEDFNTNPINREHWAIAFEPVGDQQAISIPRYYDL